MAKVVDIAIRLLTEINICMIPSGKFSNGAFKSPYPLWSIFNENYVLPTVEQLRVWDREHHPTLWGFVTGQVSGITVFDADSSETVELFHCVGLEPHVKTRKGEHFYFKYPGTQFDHLIYTVVGVIPHVDIRSKGGFVNCLGSNSTASYTMLKSPSELYDVKQLPKEVIEGIGKLQQKKISRQGISFIDEGEMIPDGYQNRWLFNRACVARRYGDTEEIIFDQLKSLLARCPKTKAYPFTDTDLRKIAHSACKYKPQKYEPQKLIVRGGALI